MIWAKLPEINDDDDDDDDDILLTVAAALPGGEILSLCIHI